MAFPDLSHRLKIADCWFPIALAAAIVLKFVLVSDLAVLIQYAPHDDGVYVTRAYHLLTGQAFGPYDSRTLVKLPGMSFWLVGTRLLGVPYLWSINLLHIAAGCYFLLGAMQCGVGRRLALAAFVVYLFSPLTMGQEWMRVLREPLSTGLLVVLFASMLFILLSLESRRFPAGHLAVFSLVLAFSVLLREEDVLLYGVVLMLGAAVSWNAWRTGSLGTRAARAAILAVVAIPIVTAWTANATARQFVARHYGMPLLHDFTEGEFPKLIAAIRSIESAKDNRYVMITQERLVKLVAEVPRLRPVIDRLPPPGPATYSCERYKVCTEWANGWMPYWIKDSTQLAGLAPNLPAAQEFFRAAREDIERACSEGRLRCHPDGSGLLPPFDLRWTRAYLQELSTLLAMTASPHPHLQEGLPARYAVDTSFGRVFQFVTMTHDFDTEVQKNPKLSMLRYTSPLADWRAAAGVAYYVLSFGFVLLVAAALALRLALWDALRPSAFSVVMMIFLAYTLARLAAIAYAAVYLGHFDNRLVYSTHSFLLLTGLPVIAEALAALKSLRGRTTGFRGAA